jgi:hypothetical protein
LCGVLVEEEDDLDLSILGIDLGKNSCSLSGLDEPGAVVFRKRMQRHRLHEILTSKQPCVVAMEARCGAHQVGRYCVELFIAMSDAKEKYLKKPHILRPVGAVAFNPPAQICEALLTQPGIRGSRNRVLN